MSQPLARLYDLALRALDEQDRRADALRGRLGPVLAAALGVSLLSGPLIGGTRPFGIAGKAAVALALGGLVVMIAALFRLLGARRRPVDDIDSRQLAADLEHEGVLADDDAFYEAMISRLGARLHRSKQTTEQLTVAFTAMLWGILAMLCGLALAAIVG